MNRGSTFFRLYRDQGRSRTARLARRTWVYPLALEKAYARAVAKYLRKSTERAIDDALTYYSGSHADAVDLGSGMEPAAGALLVIAKDLDKFNGKQWSMFQEIAVGSAWDEAEPWVQPTLERWARDQVTLIKNSQGTIQQYVTKRVRDAIRDGRTTAELKERLLKDLPGMSDRRAQLIARDQCAKLNGELTRGRMEDAGLETYIWETSMDERVRGREGGLYPDAVPSHWVMQGKVCRWDNPGVYRNDQGEWVARPDNAPTEHPGMAIQCRCVATPNWDELEDPSLDGVPYTEAPGEPVNGTRTQTEHPERQEGETSAGWVARMTGLSTSEAEDLADSVGAYTSIGYIDVRRYQNGLPVKRATAAKEAEGVERFIANSPKWDGGTTYRGVITDVEELPAMMEALANGGVIDMRGTSSWTTNRTIAEHFSLDQDDDRVLSIIFECHGKNRGSSIKAISQIPREDEILVSKDARYHITGTRQESKKIIFEVEEVSDGW